MELHDKKTLALLAAQELLQELMRISDDDSAEMIDTVLIEIAAALQS